MKMQPHPAAASPLASYKEVTPPPGRMTLEIMIKPLVLWTPSMTPRKKHVHSL